MKTSNALILGSVIVVIVGLVLLGRNYGGVSDTNNYAAGSHGGNGYGGAAAGQPAPNMSLSKLGGGTVSLADYAGKKAVVVDFWASWCPNCRRDMPNLNRFYEKYKGKVEVVGINLQENEGTVRDFINSRGISFPIALDPGGQASNAFGIRYTNTHFLIDKSGNIIRTIPGDISESDFQSLLQ